MTDAIERVGNREAAIVVIQCVRRIDLNGGTENRHIAVRRDILGNFDDLLGQDERACGIVPPCRGEESLRLMAVELQQAAQPDAFPVRPERLRVFRLSDLFRLETELRRKIGQGHADGDPLGNQDSAFGE